MISDVDLLVPIADAVDWEPWLTNDLSVEAEKLHVGYDGGEEDGRFETHLFLGTSASTIKGVAERVLRKRGFDRQVEVTADDKVTVQQDPASPFLVPLLLTGAYGRVTKGLCADLSSNPALREWLHDAGYGRLLYRSVQREPASSWHFQKSMVADGLREGDVFVVAPLDMSICDQPHATTDAIREAARVNLGEVLGQLAVFLGSPLPVLPELAGEQRR